MFLTSNMSGFIDALKTGSLTAVLGMCIVFVVLAIIYFALIIMRKVLNKKPKAKKTAEPTPAPVSAPAPAPKAAPAAEETDDCAIVAAIMAAISAHTGKPITSFRVVSFKRRH
jgi:sodium pump decarboxylase gamma subunit